MSECPTMLSGWIISHFSKFSFLNFFPVLIKDRNISKVYFKVKTPFLKHDSFFIKKCPNPNKDILFLIFEELQDNSKALFSCLVVNRIWCETVFQFYGKIPGTTTSITVIKVIYLKSLLTIYLMTLKNFYQVKYYP
jgi:hypothetical protein